MMRRSLLILCLLAVAGLGWADADAPRVEEESRLVQFRRDLELIETFVEKGLVLAAEDDPLQRAQTCKTLADRLGSEIKGAEKRTGRLVALGDMLRTVLVRGVADNLERARAAGPPPKDFAQIGSKVNEMTEAVEGILKETLDGLPDGAARESMAPALKALTRAREDIESAMSGKKRDHEDKGKGKSKGKLKFKF
jgi:hypothetical protein